MKALILTAGLGTRMQKAYPGIHKNMLTLDGKPLLQRSVEHLKKYGFDEIYMNLHFLPNQIKDFFGDGSKFGVKIKYSFEDEKPLGTSGALVNFVRDLNETFLVLYGDIFTTIDLEKFLKFHKDKKSYASLLVHTTDHPDDSDLVAIDKSHKIYKFFISPHVTTITETNLSSAAIYLIEPEALSYLPKEFPNDFVEDFFPLLLEKGFDMYGYLSSEYSKDMGTPERYEKVKKHFLEFKS